MLDSILEFFGVHTSQYDSLLSECKKLLCYMKKNVSKNKDRINIINIELSKVNYENATIYAEKFCLESNIHDLTEEILSLEKLLNNNPSMKQLKLGLFFARTTINSCQLGHSVMRSLQNNRYSDVDHHMALYNLKQDILIKETI